MQPFYQSEYITLYHGDCLDVMAGLPALMFDASITDVPYGTTACAWDSPIPFEPMWGELRRVGKPRAAHVLFGQEPFSSALRASNFQMYKYDWIWVKTRSSDFFNNKNRPREIHEVISVFSDGTTANGSPIRMPYYPQGLVKVDRQWKRPQKYESEHRIARPSHALERTIEFENYPETVLYFANPNQGTLHPTQKPLALMEYLIKTYTNPGDLILDFTCGSGTTLRAAKNLKRRAVGIEQSEHYCNVTVKRLEPTFEAALVDEGLSLADLPMFEGVC